jgi:hypothetical protein
MLKINPNPTFKATVQITVPESESSIGLELEFKRRGRDAMEAWIAGTKEKSGATTAREDAEVLMTAVVGWGSSVRGDDGEPVAFNVDTLAGFLDAYPAAAQDIGRAYVKRQMESRAKN